jgi:hypothetical protein
VADRVSRRKADVSTDSAEEPVAGDDRRADAGDICGEAAGRCCSELV